MSAWSPLRSDPGLARTLGLTARELEVLARVAAGETNEAIGERLAISPRTVQKHLERVFKKLRVRTRTAAVARAVEVASDADGRRAGRPRTRR